MDLRLEFELVSEDIYKVFVIDSEGKREIGMTYKIDDNTFVTRSKDAPNLEKYGSNKVESVMELLGLLGEIQDEFQRILFE